VTWHVRRMGSGRRLAAEGRAVRQVVHPQFKRERVLPTRGRCSVPGFRRQLRRVRRLLLFPCHVPRLPRLALGLGLRLQLLLRFTTLWRCVGCHVTSFGSLSRARATAHRPCGFRNELVATLAHAASAGVGGGPRCLTDSLRPPPSRTLHAVSERTNGGATLCDAAHCGRTQDVFRGRSRQAIGSWQTLL
jgi:hypothetical protein